MKDNTPDLDRSIYQGHPLKKGPYVISFLGKQSAGELVDLLAVDGFIEAKIKAIECDTASVDPLASAKGSAKCHFAV